MKPMWFRGGLMNACRPKAAAAALAGLLVSSDAAFTIARAQSGEIVVTTRKREERLTDLPLSVSAFGLQELENRGVDDLFDLARHVPGLDFETTGSIAGARPIIRGLNQQTRVGDEVNVATFVDGVYTPGFTGTTSLGFGGLERVEVAKGPQSALQGRNSFAGSINYMTKRPGGEFEYGARSAVAGKGKWEASAYAAGPVVGDRLGIRIDGGYFDSGGTHESSVTGERLNDRDSWFVRVNADFKAGDTVGAFLSLSYQDDRISPSPQSFFADDDPRLIGKPAAVSPFERGESGAAGLCEDGLGSEIDCGIPRLFDGEVPSLGGPFFPDPRAVSGDREAWRAVLELTWEAGAATVTSLTGYQDRRASAFSDLDPAAGGTLYSGVVGRRTEILSDGPVLAQSLSGSMEDRYEISQDLRVQSNGGTVVDWLVGGYYSHEDFDDNRARCSDPVVMTSSTIYAAPCPPLPDEDVNRKTTFRSVYGALDIDVREQLDVAFEIRYTSEKKRFNEIRNVFPLRDPSDEDFAPPHGMLQDTYSFWTPRGVISFRPSQDVLLYAVAARGAKSGGFNSGEILPSERLYEPETNWTYEAGGKFTLFETAQFNASYFHTDWRDQQGIAATALDGSSSPIVRNVTHSTIRGVEIDGFLTPTDGVALTFGYAFTDTEYDAAESTSIDGLEGVCNLLACAVNPDDAGEGPITVSDISGLAFSSVSRHAGNVGLEIVRPLLNTGFDMFGRVDALLRGKRYIDDSNTGFLGTQTTINLRAGMQNENLSMQGFCTNVTNDDTPVRSFLLRNFLGVPHRVVVEREGRKCGAELSFSY